MLNLSHNIYRTNSPSTTCLHRRESCTLLKLSLLTTWWMKSAPNSASSGSTTTQVWQFIPFYSFLLKSSPPKVLFYHASRCFICPSVCWSYKKHLWFSKSYLVLKTSLMRVRFNTADYLTNFNVMICWMMLRNEKRVYIIFFLN